MAPEEEKISVMMILYADLKCPCCYKKVRKLLCKFPQIRDQVFDVDNNKVIITVVCCDPESLRDKLCCKGGGAIQSIEIVENRQSLEQQTPPQEIDYPKDKSTKQKKPKSPPPEFDKTEQDPPVSACCQECYEGRDGGPCRHGFGRPVSPPVPVNRKPCPPKSTHPPETTTRPPISACCQECYEGRDGGPCHHGYGRPVPPPVRVNYKPCPPKSTHPPKTTTMPPISACCQECYEGRDGGPCHHGNGRPVPPSVPVNCKPCPPKSAHPPKTTTMPPVSACCQECYEGRGGGPCHCCYGRPVPPPTGYYYSGYVYPSNRPCYASRCDYLSEDNPQGCTIM